MDWRHTCASSFQVEWNGYDMGGEDYLAAWERVLLQGISTQI